MSFEFTNESCFDLLPRIPSNSVDLILIDPPYEISRPTNFQSGEETGRDRTGRGRILHRPRMHGQRQRPGKIRIRDPFTGSGHQDHRSVENAGMGIPVERGYDPVFP